jgi:hypothetical protein
MYVAVVSLEARQLLRLFAKMCVQHNRPTTVETFRSAPVECTDVPHACAIYWLDVPLMQMQSVPFKM